MCTKFTALTVREGDAFLLEDNGWKCLFDSGKDKTIVELLKYKGIEILDLAVCSHNDADHSKGFIALLKSDIKIEEIWLPGLWASVLTFVKDNGINREDVEWDCEYYNGVISSLFSEESISSDFFFNSSFWKEMMFSEEQINRIHDKLIDHITRHPEMLVEFIRHIIQLRLNTRYDDRAFFEDYFREYSLNYRESHMLAMHTFCNLTSPYYSSQESDTFESVKRKLIRSLKINLRNIIEIAKLAHQRGCTIRWFEPVSICSNDNNEYDFVPLNSREMGRIKKLKSSMSYFYALALTKENKHSLVFEYLKEKIPIIRFSADSDCTCQSVSPYSKNIIVTAPHHGSIANHKVYNALQGDNIIWVRSDKMSNKRPCPMFKHQQNKYCLACKKYNYISEICFEYNTLNKQWVHVKGTQCMCK
jgi:hypothetical protein